MITWVHRALESRRRQDEAGFALILVMGFTVIILGLLLVGATVSINSLRSTKVHGNFEQALAVAEAGVDQTLARLQVNTAYNPCVSPYCALPSTGFATDAAERAWARTALLAYANVSANLQSTSQGQFVAIRPTGGQKVYAMSWVPSKSASDAKTRILKADYLFAPYKPGNAFSAQSNVQFVGGSVEIRCDVNDVTCSQTPMHTNGDMGGTANSINVAGPVTSSGTYSLPNNANVGAGSGGLQPLETVPRIDPLKVYQATDSAKYASAWYDLCPDGKVRSKASTTPCTGTVLADLTLPTTTIYRGWTWAVSGNNVTWTMGFPDSPYAGVYYVYQGDAVVNGGTTGNNTPPWPGWNATVLAEAKEAGSPGNSATCNKSGGNITWHNTNIHALYPGLVLEAGSDLTIEGSSNHMDLGLFAATDQVYLQSASATFVTGAVIASDVCPNSSSPSSLQGITIDFNTTFESPVTSIVRTTQWIEFVG